MILKLTIFERLLRRFHFLPTPIMDAFGGVIFGRVLTIAVRRGVFETVAAQPRSASEIAEATQLRVEGVELMLDAFVAGGYLRRVGQSYGISEEGKKWLLQSSPQYLGNLIQYFETLYSRWTNFEYSLEHGKPKRPYFELFTDEDWRIYVYGMRDLATLIMPEILPLITPPARATSLLDVGGSHGLYAIECCRRHPALHATVVDFAPALRHTREILAMENMHERIGTREADFTTMELPSNQDCVLMFNVIHGMSAEENATLISNVFSVLNTGGKLFILDQMKESGRRSQLGTIIPLMVGLNLLNEIGGNVYDAGVVKSWCRMFASVRTRALRLPGVTLIEATK